MRSLGIVPMQPQSHSFAESLILSATGMILQRLLGSLMTDRLTWRFMVDEIALAAETASKFALCDLQMPTAATTSMNFKTNAKSRAHLVMSAANPREVSAASAQGDLTCSRASSKSGGSKVWTYSLMLAKVSGI